MTYAAPDSSVKIWSSAPSDRISCFSGSTDTTVKKTISWQDAIALVRDGKYADQISRLRQICKSNLDKYSQEKKKLPGVTFAGTFKKSRAKVNIDVATGFIVADLDHLSNINQTITLLKQDEYVWFIFISPSNNGIKVGFRASCIVNDADIKQFYQAIERYFKDTYEFKTDKQCSDISRLTYLSYDPGAYVNENAAYFPLEQWIQQQPSPNFDNIRVDTSSATGKRKYALKVLTSACAEIRQSQPGEQHGTRLRMARLVGGYGQYLSEAEVHAELEAAVRASGAQNIAAAMKTIADGLGMGRAVPIVIPDILPGHRPRRSQQAAQRKASAGTLPQPPDGAMTVIPGQLHRLIEEIEAAMAGEGLPEDLRIYAQPTRLVRLVRNESETEERGITRFIDAPRVVEVGVNFLLDAVPRILEKLDRALYRFNKRSGEWGPCDLPKDVAAALIARDGLWNVSKLCGFAEAPVLLPDGTLIQGPGYDRTTGLYVAAPAVNVPEHPTRDDALRATAVLGQLLEEFPFAEEVDFAAGLAALLTAVARSGLPTSPIVLVDGRCPGTGKSELCNTVAALATGRRASCIAAGQDNDEDDKRLATALMAGDSVIVLDNRTRPLGSDLTAQAATQSLVKIRRFGRLADVSVPNTSLLLANGNGIQIRADLARRSILVRLDAKMEHPESRRFRRNPIDDILADRPKFLNAALIILRAYILAGKPGADTLEPLAGFDEWRSLICGAVTWLDLPDPLGNREALAAEDLDFVQLQALLAAWRGHFGPTPATAREACNAAAADDGAMGEAIAEICGTSRGDLDAKRLGYFLRTRRGRIAGGLFFEKSNHGMGGVRWLVRAV